MKARFLPFVLLAASAAAQQSFTLPTFQLSNSLASQPFGSIRIHYQLWFAASEWMQSVDHPMAVTGIDFMTAANGQTGRTKQMEIRMANAQAVSWSGLFQSNMVSGETLVFPSAPGAPRSFTTPTSVAGAFALQIPFQNEFIWDGSSGVVVDIKIFDNGNGNQPHPYDLQVETVGNNRIVMMWDESGNPDAIGATRIFVRGPRCRINFRDGVSVPFGAGCPGQGFTTPVATTFGGSPLPGNLTWGHRLSAAPSQRPAIWMFGNSNTIWNTLPLPHEMVEVGGFNCDLLVKVDLTFSTTTIGGGPGAGTAQLNTPTPPVSTLSGLSFYTQWFVLDPNAPNGVLAGSNGQWHYFGP